MVPPIGHVESSLEKLGRLILNMHITRWRPLVKGAQLFFTILFPNSLRDAILKMGAPTFAGFLAICFRWLLVIAVELVHV